MNEKPPRRLPQPIFVIALLALAIHGRGIGFPLLGDDVWQFARLPSSPSMPLIARAWTTDHWGGQSAGLWRPLAHTLWLGEAAVGGGA